MRKKQLIVLVLCSILLSSCSNKNMNKVDSSMDTSSNQENIVSEYDEQDAGVEEPKSTPTPIVLPDEFPVAPADSIEYKIENGEAIITNMKDKTLKVFTFPSEIEGYPVTTIGDGEKGIVYNYLIGPERFIVIPEGVKYIAAYAFAYSDINYVKLPSTLKEIGSKSFEDNDLQEIVIPEGIESLGDAFSHCESLRKVTLPESIISLDNSFTGCTNLSEINLPTSLESIGCNTFSYTNLEEVDLPENLKEIGLSAFRNCQKLKEITIPKNVSGELYDIAPNCDSLIAIHVQEGNVSFKDEKGILYSKDGTILIQYPAGKEETEFTMPDQVDSLSSNVFEGCDYLIKVEISKNVTRINYGVFSNCTMLEEVVLPKDLEYIENRAFENCQSLQDFSIGSKVCSIGERAFLGCSNISQVKVDTNNAYFSDIEGVLFDFNQAELLFYPSAKLDTTYQIKEGVTFLREGAFYQCNNLKSINMPSSLKVIGTNAISNCSGITEIVLPEGLTKMDYQAISSNDNLISVSMPSSLLEISIYAIDYAPSVSELMLTVYAGSVAETYAIENAIKYKTK